MSAFSDAAQPQIIESGPFTVYGEIVTFDAEHRVLQKGVKGGVPFDPNQHDLSKRLTMVDVLVQPLSASSLDRPVERRGIVVEFESSAWNKTMLPSLTKLGYGTPEKLESLAGKFCKIIFSPTGRTWTNAKGEKVDETGIEFLEIWDNEKLCEDAYFDQFGTATVSPSAQSATQQSSAFGTAAKSNAPSNDTMKANAEKFLPNIVAAANGDIDALKQSLAAMPLVKDFFTIDSPEVQSLLG